MIKVCNAFSIQMLKEFPALISFKEISKDDAINLLQENEIDSYIGHADICRVLLTELGISIPAQRRFATLDKDDKILVIQYIGSRLPEGATQLPENCSFKYIMVSQINS